MADNKDNYNLYTEKIKVKPEVKYRHVLFLIRLALLAAFAGAIAAMAFIAVINMAGGLDKPEEDLRHEITIPMDEYPGSKETTADNYEQTSSEAVSEGSTENMDASAAENPEDSMDAESGIYNYVAEQLAEVKPSMVSITAIDQNVDPLFAMVEEELTFPGVIIADNEVEYLILTDYAIAGVDYIEVTFADGAKADAAIIAADKTLGLAIVAVNHNKVLISTRKALKIVELGNSYMLKQGEMVMAAGNMFGADSVVNLGMAISTNENVLEADSRHGVIHTNMNASDEMAGFLFNELGQLIGCISEDYSTENIVAYGISDIKVRIQNMTNVKKIGYLGVLGQGISEEMAIEHGLVRGVFVSSTEKSSPAYFAGITSGDIITSINEREITSIYNLERAMCEFEPGTEVKVIVNRKGRSGYVPIEFTITLSEK